MREIVSDYIAGMTDRFALQRHATLIGGTELPRVLLSRAVEPRRTFPADLAPNRQAEGPGHGGGRLLFSVLTTTLAAGVAEAFPLDGTYYSDCVGEGIPAEGARWRRGLAFPEVCFDGACCELSNPTRLRGLPDQFPL